MGLNVITDAIHFTQAVASLTWVINHNLGTLAPVVDCWFDDNGLKSKIIPVSVDATDVNNCTITFFIARSGEAIVV